MDEPASMDPPKPATVETVSSTPSSTIEEPMPGGKVKRRNRRSASEDFINYNMDGNSNSNFPPFPPAQISYQQNTIHSSVRSNGSSSGGLPPTHHRGSSWNGQQGPPLPPNSMMMPPPYGMSPPVVPSPYGSPYGSFGPVGGPPPLNPYLASGGGVWMGDPSAAALPPAAANSYSGHRRKRSSHRRVHSYGGVTTNANYGAAAFFDSQPSERKNPAAFSPRNEFYKVAGITNTPAGSERSAAGGNNASYRPPMSPRPPISPHPSGTPTQGPRGVYGMDPNMSPMILPPVAPLTGGGGSNHGGGGGEAVFLHNSSHRRQKSGQMDTPGSTSTRKRHMRQQSAQLFMEEFKGTEQLPACRDLIWLLLFVFHLILVVYLGNRYGYEALKLHDDVPDTSIGGLISVTISYRNVLWVSWLSGSFAVIISALTLLLMTAIAKKLVQVALILTITLSFAWGTIGVGLSPKKVVPVTGIIALLFSVAYSFIVWDRIPFAAANLNAGLHGIRANPGAVYIAFGFQFLALGWSIYFSYVCVGIYDAMEVGDIEVSESLQVAIYAGLAISYYWTLHVFLNIVQVTVAGVIGSWWFTLDGDASGRGEALTRSFFRSMFYAIGSICFGSLVVGPVRLLRQLSAFFRPSEEGSSLLCLHECLFCIQSCLSSGVDYLSDRFNSSGFTYIGLYGYDLVGAGLNATELFDKRGWTTIVSDDLVPNVLLMTSLVIGGMTGCVAHLIENIETLSLTNLNQPVAISFLVGSLVGLVVSSVLFGIINSSVNAVTVCFAANPMDFEQNHPELSQEMRAAWREVWPGCMDVVDMRAAVAAYLDPSILMNDRPGETMPLLP